MTNITYEKYSTFNSLTQERPREQGQLFYPYLLNETTAGDDALFILAIQEEEIVGFACAPTSNKKDEIFLSRMETRDDLSKTEHRVGSNVLKALCQAALDTGFSKIRLLSEDDAEIFYEKCGFEKVASSNPNYSCFEGKTAHIIETITQRNAPKFTGNNITYQQLAM
jgi:N-acetylglutamate synthase-like GNAT family acetyltransferase